VALAVMAPVAAVIAVSGVVTKPARMARVTTVATPPGTKAAMVPLGTTAPTDRRRVSVRVLELIAMLLESAPAWVLTAPGPESAPEQMVLVQAPGLVQTGLASVLVRAPILRTHRSKNSFTTGPTVSF
jgi:hypothetical protein